MQKLDELKNKKEMISVQHDSFAHDTRVQLKQALDTLHKLTGDDDKIKKHPIVLVKFEIWVKPYRP